MGLTQVSSRLIEDTLRYVLGASSTNHYTFTGKGLTGAVNDPTLTLSRGHTYIFENRNSSGAHPFYIKTSIANGGTNDAYNTGVTNNGGAGGTEIVFTVPHDAPDLLYYQCSSHINMAGELKVAGAVADGSITTAKLADNSVTAAKISDIGAIDNTNQLGSNVVTESKIADGAVTSAKIANSTITSADFSADCVGTAALANDAVTNAKLATNAVGGGNLQQNAVETAKIQDQAVTLAKLPHGTSSNDGKFLRANNGADPSFETVDLANLNASNLTSGTVPDARLPNSISSDITGNAATATQFATARNIAGTSFNGTANIDINYNNLINRPTIPTNNNQLTNGAGYVTSGGEFSAYAVVGDQKGATTDGGTFSSGAFRTRDLNTEFADPHGIVSVSSNRFHLGAGSYMIVAAAPCYNTYRHVALVHDVTGNGTAIMGQTSFNANGMSVSWCIGRVSFGGSRSFEVRHRCDNGRTSIGFGIAHDYGGYNAVYTIVQIFKES